MNDPLKILHDLKTEIRYSIFAQAHYGGKVSGGLETASESALATLNLLRSTFTDAVVAHLRENYRYDENDGHFYRKTKTKKFKIGSRVGVKERSGYWKMTIFSRSMLAHRMVWL